MDEVSKRNMSVSCQIFNHFLPNEKNFSSLEVKQKKNVYPGSN